MPSGTSETSGAPEGSGANGSAHEDRVRKVLVRARREVGLRDVLTFAIARIWAFLLVLGSGLYVWFAEARRVDSEPHRTDAT